MEVPEPLRQALLTTQRMASSSLPLVWALSAYTTPTDDQRSQPEKQMDTVAELQQMAPVYPASVKKQLDRSQWSIPKTCSGNTTETGKEARMQGAE